MRYHNITKDDMNNGDGLRVVLWVAGCNHRCPGCQNPITWDPAGGLIFGYTELQELYEKLNKPYISGLTLSGGDPFHPNNSDTLATVALGVKTKFPDKTIWCYTGYLFEEIKDQELMSYIDILVDGPFIQELADIQYPWAGSTNQRVIDVKKSLENGEVVLYESK